MSTDHKGASVVMKRLKLFWLAVVVLVVASLGMATAAFAEEDTLIDILPLTINRFTGANVGNTRLEALGGTTVECTRASGEGVVENDPPRGTWHIHFENCTSLLGVKCTGEDAGVKDKEGDILALGDYRIVHDVSERGNTFGIMFLPSDVTFTCAGTKVVVLGDILCLILEPEVSRITHEFHCKNNGTRGDPEEKKWWQDGLSGEAICLVSINGGKEESCAQIGLATFTTFVTNTMTASAVMGV
jgi:hypothetical protein